MINGDRVRQARELSGLTQKQLADAIEVRQSSIAQIETGRITPTSSTLQRIVMKTGFPLPFFRRPAAVEFPDILFRARRASTVRERKKVRQCARTAYELVEFLERDVRGIPLRLPSLDEETTEEAAAQTRSALGLSPDSPIANVVQAIEKVGVLVLALPLEFAKVDAFSVWIGDHSLRPIVVLCAKVPTDRLRLSVAHELGHLVMHRRMDGSISDLDKEADRFAGEFLMPREAMLAELKSPITLSYIASLKPRWKVSMQALIHRAQVLRKITPRQYKYLMQQMSMRGWRTREPSHLDLPVERPRALRQMAELIYGNPPNYDQLAKDMNLPAAFVRDLVEVHAGKTPHWGPKMRESSTSPSKKVIPLSFDENQNGGSGQAR